MHVGHKVGAGLGGLFISSCAVYAVARWRLPKVWGVAGLCPLAVGLAVSCVRTRQNAARFAAAGLLVDPDLINDDVEAYLDWYCAQEEPPERAIMMQWVLCLAYGVELEPEEGLEPCWFEIEERLSARLGESVRADDLPTLS